MIVKFLNVQRRTGTSTKPGKVGNKYDICEIEYLVPLSDKTTENYVYQAYGYGVRSLRLATHALAKFTDTLVGDDVDITLEPNPDRPQENICVGLAKK